MIGSFSLVLNVARAAVKNGKIATLTYKQALDAAAKGILEFLITDDGYLVMRSDDKLGLAQGLCPAPSIRWRRTSQRAGYLVHRHGRASGVYDMGCAGTYL